MVLVLDIGNTALSFATYENEKRTAFFTVLTEHNLSEDEYTIKLQPLLSRYCLTLPEAIFISSVVPSITPMMVTILTALLHKKPIVFSKGFKTGLPIQIDHPSELGSDLVVDGVQAMNRYGYPCIIADLGTATKLIGIDQHGRLIGVSILPGFMISYQALIGKASQLMDIPLKRPTKILGKNTPDSMTSGVILGHEAMVFNLIDGIEKEMGYPCKKIMTGGYSHYFHDHLPSDVQWDPFLNVDGLFTIYQKNKELFL